MASINIAANGNATITVPAGSSIAVFTRGTAQVYQLVGYPNYPTSKSLIGTVSAGQTVFGSYSSGATIIIEAGASTVQYEVGTSPLVQSELSHQLQGNPVALDATGSLTVAGILGGIVTSSTAAAVTATLPTGTVLDAGSNFAIGDSFDWSAINTGPNTFTVTAATAHTVVGAGAVATGTSGRFRTRKTAAGTFVTYRLS